MSRTISLLIVLLFSSAVLAQGKITDTYRCEDVFTEAFVRDHFQLEESVAIQFANNRANCRGFWGASSTYDPAATVYYVQITTYSDEATAAATFERIQSSQASNDDYAVQATDSLGSQAFVSRRYQTQDSGVLHYTSSVVLQSGTTYVTVRQAHSNADNSYDAWSPQKGEEMEGELLRLAKAVALRL